MQHHYYYHFSCLTSSILLLIFLPCSVHLLALLSRPTSPLQHVALWQDLQYNAVLKLRCSAEIGVKTACSPPALLPNNTFHFLPHFLSLPLATPNLSLPLSLSGSALPSLSLSCSVFSCQRPIQLFIQKCLCTHA